MIFGNIVGNGRALEVKDILAKFMTDIIGITAYGIKFNSLTDPDALVRRVGKGIFNSNYKRHISLLSAWMIPGFVKMFNIHFLGKGASDFLRSIFWEAINERLKSGIKRADLIDLLTDLKNEQEGDSEKVTCSTYHFII